MTNVLELLIRSIKKGSYYEVAETNADDRATRMLTYINEHINKPEVLKVDHLASAFAMSPTYVSEFFRKQIKDVIAGIHYKSQAQISRDTSTEFRLHPYRNSGRFSLYQCQSPLHDIQTICRHFTT